MKYFINIINCILVVVIGIVLYTTPIKKYKAMNIDAATKKISSDKLVVKKNNNDEIEESSEIEDTEETIKEQEIKEEKTVQESTIAVEKNVEVATPVEIKEEKSDSDVIETQIGKMSGYGPDCIGCSGKTSSGQYVGNGNIYYNDATYGTVRIVAGDYKYKFGSIVRIKNSKVSSSPILAIVLDRGTSIGLEKKYMFDLLFESEDQALKYEVSKNVTFEILRLGY